MDNPEPHLFCGPLHPHEREGSPGPGEGQPYFGEGPSCFGEGRAYFGEGRGIFGRGAKKGRGPSPIGCVYAGFVEKVPRLKSHLLHFLSHLLHPSRHPLHLPRDSLRGTPGGEALNLLSHTQFHILGCNEIEVTEKVVILKIATFCARTPYETRCQIRDSQRGNLHPRDFFSGLTKFAPENAETAGYEQIRCFAENPPGLDMTREDGGPGTNPEETGKKRFFRVFDGKVLI